MELSGKPKTFFDFFSSFLKSSLNLQHFQKKHDPHNCCMSEITDSEKHGWSIPKKSCFRVSVEKQHGKGPQTLFKFEGQPLYHFY